MLDNHKNTADHDELPIPAMFPLDVNSELAAINLVRNTAFADLHELDTDPEIFLES